MTKNICKLIALEKVMIRSRDLEASVLEFLSMQILKLSASFQEFWKDQ